MSSPATSYMNRVPFLLQLFLSSAGATTNTALNPDSPKSFADQDLWAIPLGCLITKVYFIVDVIITGTTDLDVGDDDTSNGFIDGSLSITLGTTGMYGWDSKLAGTYLRTQTAGATDAADIYVVPQAKYYKAAGKTMKLDITTANTAGKARVVVEGVMLGAFGG